MRRFFGALVLLIGILLFLSFAGYAEGDWPMTSQDHIGNICGKFGALVSFWGFFLFGLSAWIWPLAACIFGGIALSGREMSGNQNPGWVTASCTLLLVFTCGTLFLIWPQDKQIGGRLGWWLVDRLAVFGRTGTAVILTFCGIAGVGGLLPANWWMEVRKLLLEIPGQFRIFVANLFQQVKNRVSLRKPIPVTPIEKPLTVLIEQTTAQVPLEPPPLSMTLTESSPPSGSTPSKTIPFPKREREESAQSSPALIKTTISKPDGARESKFQDDETPEEKEFRKALAKFRIPPLELLKWPPEQDGGVDQKHLQDAGQILEDTLKNFGIDAQVVQIVPGPTVTLYEVLPAPGVSVSRIAAREADLKLALAADSVRIEAPIPGKSVVGIEVPARNPKIVKLRELLAFEKFSEGAFTLPFALGKNILGKAIIIDLQKMPHILIAGATGSGKSICIASLLATLLYRLSPANLRLILIDPKRVELSMFSEIPHLLSPPILDAKSATRAFKWLMIEMENRYNILSDSGAKNLESYNSEQIKLGMMPVPYIVLVVDELADLMLVAPRETEGAITRLSQMSRAVGIHLVLATQRPSVDVITGLIKANMPARIAFQVASQFDSRTILDAKGAESLLGRGDMLFLSPSAPKPIRLQGAYVDEEEIRRVVDFIRGQMKPAYVDFDAIPENMMPLVDANTSKAIAENTEEVDPQLYEEAKRFIIQIRKGSTSMLQRKFKIGFNRATKIIEMLEKDGIVGPNKGPTPRDVLVGPPRQLEEEEIRG